MATPNNTRNLAIQHAEIVRINNMTYRVHEFELIEQNHDSIGAAKRYVRESGKRCVANMPNEKPSVLVRMKAHLGQLRVRHEKEVAAKKAAEEATAETK